MKVKKCPYCGKRVSFLSTFSSRRKGEYVCERCGKESKVIIDKRMFFLFAVAVVISLAIMAGWIFAGLLSNPLGILLVAIPLVIFEFFTPKFVYYEPLKKYKKSMEARKAGIAYSDNLVTSDLNEKEKIVFPTPVQSEPAQATQNFQINSDVFNKIRAERNAARAELQGKELISDSAKINADDEENFVSIINDVSEQHVSTQAPLRKIHSEVKPKATIERSRHYIPIESDSHEEVKKSTGNRYSSNRKF